MKTYNLVAYAMENLMNESRIHNKLLHMYMSLEDEGMANLALLELKARYPFYKNTVTRRP